jgi:hypothetical protein
MEVMHENKYPLLSRARDPRLLTLRSLQTPQGRSRTGLYIIEGIRHLARAVEQKCSANQLYRDLTLASELQGIGAVVRQQ